MRNRRILDAVAAAEVYYHPVVEGGFSGCAVRAPDARPAALPSASTAWLPRLGVPAGLPGAAVVKHTAQSPAIPGWWCSTGRHPSWRRPGRVAEEHATPRRTHRHATAALSRSRGRAGRRYGPRIPAFPAMGVVGTVSAGHSRPLRPVQIIDPLLA